jgi:putative MFS transporter
MRSFATMVGSSLRALAAIIAPIVLGLLVTEAGGIAWVFGVFSAVLLVGLLAFARFGPETKQQTLEELAS